MKYFLVFCLFVLSFRVHAQIAFSPATSVEDKEVLRETIEALIDKDMSQIENGSYKDRKDILEIRQKSLLLPLRDGMFLNDSLIQKEVDDIISAIVSQYDINRPSLCLISRSTFPNASAHGAGILVVDLGLFQLVETRDELAFVIAHEIAHDHLKHVQMKIQDYNDRYSVNKLKEQGLKQRLANGDLDALRLLTYDGAKFSQKQESDADSAAFVWLEKASFNANSGRSILVKLDSVYEQKGEQPPLDLRDWLYYDEYPFKEKWLWEIPKNGLGNDDAPSFIFNRDSISSHPDIVQRISNLKTLQELSKADSLIINDFPSGFAAHVDLELLSSAMTANDLLTSFYQLSVMINDSPEEPYFQEQLCAFFINLHKIRKDHTFGKHIPPYLEKEHPLNEYNTFLNNLRISEIAKLAFHQFKDRVEFDASKESHYWMKAKVLELVNAHEDLEKIKREYSASFPNGNLFIIPKNK